MEFPREVYVFARPDGSEMGVLTCKDTPDGLEVGSLVAIYRLVRSGPLVRKVEIGQPPRKRRKDAGVPRKTQPEA